MATRRLCILALLALAAWLPPHTHTQSVSDHDPEQPAPECMSERRKRVVWSHFERYV